jgi:hypothetical protein
MSSIYEIEKIRNLRGWWEGGGSGGQEGRNSPNNICTYE